MTRMHDTIRRSLRNLRKSMEDEAAETLSDFCILHFLYGPREGKKSDVDSLKASLQIANFMETVLGEESPEVFTELLREFFTDGPESGDYVRLFTVEATPSEEAAEALAAEERELVRSREQELGPEGLEAAQETQEAAQEEALKSTSFSDALGLQLKFPQQSSISLPGVVYRYLPVDSSKAKGSGVFSDSVLNAIGHSLPYEVELMQVDTAFATIDCLFSTQSLDLRQRRWVCAGAVT